MRFVIAKSIFLVAFCLVAAITSSGQTFTSLFSFGNTNGANPQVGLIQGGDGDLYGTTQVGGTYGAGTIFRMSPMGELTTLYSFCSQSNCGDGSNPSPGLLLATSGNFYGMTSWGGASGSGTVFKITPQGKLTTLYSFCSQIDCTDGAFPEAPLVQASNGNFYGTTFSGGASGNGTGTIFEITPQGKLTTLYSFCSQTNCADGESPQGGLVQASSGNFYGTTTLGGAEDYGSVFEITPAGALTTLYSFCSQTNCADGANPYAGLVQASNGNLYGTTSGFSACPSQVNSCGTVFEITLKGKLTTLYSFCSANCTDGSHPAAALTQGTDGNLYGTNLSGGGYLAGTVFEITPKGKLTTLHSFCSQANCDDGWQPDSSLFQATNGNFYGTTPFGGTGTACYDGCGTVYSVSAGLGRFVEAIPDFGKLGGKVIILGNGLRGATGVSFNGTAAVFTMVSDTEIMTTVPTGATTGRVSVTTMKGTLKSNVVFRVLE
jgi:uncharacterized repeat protein (TIGR03803 family)